MLNYIPLVRLLIPFIIGIIFAIYLPASSSLPQYVFLGVVVSYLILFSIKKINTNYKFRWIFGVLIYGSFMLAAYSLTSIKTNQSHSSYQLNDADNRFIIAEVIEPTEEKANSVKAVVEIIGLKTNEEWKNTNGKSIIYLQKDSLANHLKLGDIISFEPVLKDVPAPKNPHEFSFKRYLSYHLIHQQAYLRSDNWKIIHQNNDISIFAYASNIRKKLITKMEEMGVKDKQLSVASALILGYKNEIDAQLKSAYSSAGAMHVLAVSGLHVGVIFLILNQILQFFNKLKYGNYIKGILIIVLLWAYALLTGLSPSVMRAATMFSFIVAAKTTKSNANFFNTLAASALFLLIINPFLLMEVGFQLSYLAVIGIVVIQPWVYNLLYSKWWLLDKIWELTAVSIAAQIATFPLGLYYFHQFPNYFLLSNLVVIPLAILILYLGIITLIVSPITIVGNFLGKILNMIILGLNEAVIFIDKIPYSLTQNIKFNLLDNYLIYLAIILIILTIHYKNLKYFMVGVACFIIIFSFRLKDNIHQINQKYLTVYNIPGHSAINLIEGNDNVLFSDIKLLNNKSKLMFHVQNNWIQKGVESEKIVTLNKLTDRNPLSTLYITDNKNVFVKRNYLQFFNAKMAILPPDFQLKSLEKPLALDLLILTKNPKFSITELLQTFKPKEIIIDASNSNYISEKLKTEAKALNINCWSVLIDGAYTKQL
ncbi:MAG: ComEC/Rec2 family competence protein [Flavobacteriales bacterium]